MSRQARRRDLRLRAPIRSVLQQQIELLIHLVQDAHPVRGAQRDVHQVVCITLDSAPVGKVFPRLLWLGMIVSQATSHITPQSATYAFPPVEATAPVGRPV